MARNNTRLELTWIGKENRPQLEPRILIEDPEKSYHAAQHIKPLSLVSPLFCRALRTNSKLQYHRSTPHGSTWIWSAETKSPLFPCAERTHGHQKRKLNGYEKSPHIPQFRCFRCHKSLMLYKNLWSDPEKGQNSSTENHIPRNRPPSPKTLNRKLLTGYPYPNTLNRIPLTENP